MSAPPTTTANRAKMSDPRVAEAMRLVDDCLAAREAYVAWSYDDRGSFEYPGESSEVKPRAALEAHLTQLLTDEYWRGVRREGPPAQPTELPKVYAPCVCSSPESIKLRNDKDGRWSCPRHGHMPKYPPVQSTECVERALQAITDFDQERERHELPDQVQAAVDEHAIQPTEPVALTCPQCGVPHIDEGEWATRPHKTHQCQSCGHEWRPFEHATVGIAHPPTSQRSRPLDDVVADMEAADPEFKVAMEAERKRRGIPPTSDVAEPVARDIEAIMSLAFDLREAMPSDSFRAATRLREALAHPPAQPTEPTK